MFKAFSFTLYLYQSEVWIVEIHIGEYKSYSVLEYTSSVRIL